MELLMSIVLQQSQVNNQQHSSGGRRNGSNGRDAMDLDAKHAFLLACLLLLDLWVTATTLEPGTKPRPAYILTIPPSRTPKAALSTASTGCGDRSRKV